MPPGRLTSQQPHLLLSLRQAFAECRPREYQLRVPLDRLSLRGKVDLIIRQPPQNRRDGCIDQRELVGQEVRFYLKQVRALQDGIAQDLLQLHRLLLVGLLVDLPREAVPVALDPVEGQAELEI